nr:CpsD/CapB family tyrosine-protein kinase [Eubacterium sp.]
ISPTLTNINDFEKDFEGLESLGVIPDDESYFASRPFDLSGEIDVEHVQVQEALISTAHMLRHMSEHEEQKCYYFTSCESGEGKTGLVANLAIELSHREKEVLVIDMDVRRPTLGGCFFKEVDHEHSLNAVYDGSVPAEEAVIDVSNTLSILPARLEHDRIRLDSILYYRIKELIDDYDIVLLDAPPVGMVSDTMLLNAIADQVIIVIKHDFVKIETIKNCIKKLKQSGMNVCGAVITNYKTNFAGAYDFTYHGNSSAYVGSKKASKKKKGKGFWKRKKDKNKTNEY